MKQKQEKNKQIKKLGKSQLRRIAANTIAQFAVLVAYFRNRKQTSAK